MPAEGKEDTGKAFNLIVCVNCGDDATMYDYVSLVRRQKSANTHGGRSEESKETGRFHSYQKPPMRSPFPLEKPPWLSLASSITFISSIRKNRIPSFQTVWVFFFSLFQRAIWSLGMAPVSLYAALIPCLLLMGQVGTGFSAWTGPGE